MIYKLSTKLFNCSSFSSKLVNASVSTHFSKAAVSMPGTPVVGASTLVTVAASTGLGLLVIALVILYRMVAPP